MEISYSFVRHDLFRAHPTDSGFDICALIDSEFTNAIRLGPSEFKTINTGIRLSLPEGLEAEIRPRSGLASKHGITVLNSPGTIDCGYRGEIKVILINHSSQEFAILDGMRIAQLLFRQTLPVSLVSVESVDSTDSSRQDKGFGSSGLN